jgi:YfiH family protein
MNGVLRSPLLTRHGFVHGSSLRTGGVSRAPYESLNLGRAVGDDPAHVAENLRRFAAAVGYRADALFEVSQVHGRELRRVVPSASVEDVRRESGDALLASEGAAVGVRSADCVPVLLADPVTRRVAAVHAGWRGVALGVVPAAIAALAVPASRLVAAVFPHIRRCCFEVGDEVAEQLAQLQGGAAAIAREHGGKPHVDLASLVLAQLTAAGLAAQNIDDVPGCTRCEPERFFSYRRDGRASGRHLTAIVSG